MVLILLATAALQAQERRRSLGPYTMYEQIVYQAKQERLMTWLSHDMNHGRATGTRDAARVARYIETHFRQYGLEPFCAGSFYQPFLARLTTTIWVSWTAISTTVPMTTPPE